MIKLLAERLFLAVWNLLNNIIWFYTGQPKFYLFFHIKVFIFCCHSATYMSLCLIYLKDSSYLTCKLWVYVLNSVGYVFMNRTFAYTKLLCCLTHSGITLYYIIGYLHSPFFYIFLQKQSPE